MSQKTASPKLVMISIDGLLPEYYLPDGLTFSWLRSVARQGAYAQSVQAVYPTLTMTNHVSLVTGMYSAHHGISSNTRFDPEQVTNWEGGESQDWFLDSSHIQSPTIWQRVSAAGRSVASVRWPVTRGADIDWLIPEVFSIGKNGPSTWDLTQRQSTPELIRELLSAVSTVKNWESYEELDQWTGAAAAYILRRYQPDLTLIHFISHDHETHEHGIKHPLAIRDIVLKQKQVEEILSVVDRDSTYVMILGDHGYLNFNKRIHINSLFQQHGWIDVRDGRILNWSVIAHTNCAQASIYLRDLSLGQKVLSLLREQGDGVFRLLTRDDLRRLNACPSAFCAIDAKEGFSMGQNLTGPMITELESPRADHGYLPHYSRLQTGLILTGPGIPRDFNLGKIQLVDVAPTAASLMKVAMPRCDGRVIAGLERRVPSLHISADSPR